MKPKRDRTQFLLKPPPSLLEKLEVQRAALGFYSSNEMSIIFLTALSEVPPEKVFECLAGIRKYHHPQRRKT